MQDECHGQQHAFEAERPAGRLARGAPADLVLFDPDRARAINTEEFLSRAKNSPFDGVTVRGQVLRTLVDGRVTYKA